ncbi:pyruvate kinase [Salinispira pacifica]
MAQLRKTKIVCTIGPAVDDLSMLKRLLEAGMNVARLNFSHGNHEEHRSRVAQVRQASRETGIPVALMLDTKGPEIRTGLLENHGTIELIEGARITVTTEQIPGTTERLSVSYPRLAEDVRPGTHIFIADGLLDLEVERVEGREMHCRVVSGGELGERKNVNVRGVRTSLPAITEKDEKDILFAVEEGLDFIAASFIRKSEDVVSILELLSKHDSSIRVIAKIEDAEGISNLDEIIRVSHGIMVARGDLGVQLATEDVPMAQKRIIQKCNLQNKPVITATQMLDSMIHNPRPTRAELTDVANAIFDGTDAVMLSGETAGGRFPIQACETLDRIALAVEDSDEYHARCGEFFAAHEQTTDIGNAVARAAYVVAADIQATAIVAPSLRGNTPRMLSKYRPMQSIVAVTVSEQVQRQLLIHWGVYPLVTSLVSDSETMIQNALRLAMQSGFFHVLDKVVSAAGMPLNSPIPINTIKIHFMGNILNRGQRGFGAVVSGQIVKADSAENALLLLKENGEEILLTRTLSRSFLPVLPRIRGLIIEEKSQISPEEIRAANPSITVIAEVPHAFQTLEDNLYVSVDGEEKIVYEGIV